MTGPGAGGAAPVAAPGTKRGRLLRLPLLLCGMASLLLGLWGGLLRIGWSWPTPTEDLVLLHGPLMVSGFFGLLISLERAVALRHPAALAVPGAAALGALLLLTGAPTPGQAAWLAAALGLAVLSAVVLRRQPALFTAILFVGTACWAVGNLLWLLGRPVPALVPWWLLFLVLTIAAERLELSRVLRPAPSSGAVFLACVAALLAGAAAGLLDRLGSLVLGGTLIALAAWLWRHDVARRTVRGRGLPRYAAIALLSGYAWLVVAGIVAMSGPVGAADGSYDAFLHAVFVGFVFAMVFGHAPIILPAVAGLPVPFKRRFYLPLALLHAALALRLAGDFGGWFELRRCGGLLTAVAILGFLAMIASAAAVGAKKGRPQAARSVMH